MSDKIRTKPRYVPQTGFGNIPHGYVTTQAPPSSFEPDKEKPPLPSPPAAPEEEQKADA